MRRAFLCIPLVVLAVLAGCEILSSSDACQTTAEAGEADFLPLAVGNTWTYQYRAGTLSVGSGRRRHVGTLALSVSAVECTGGEALYTLQERRTGTQEWWNAVEDRWESSDLDLSRTVEFKQDADGQMLLPYGNERNARFHPAGQDTVRASVGLLRDIPVGGIAGCDTYGTDVHLVRDVGMVFFDAACGRVSYSRSLSLELLDAERP